MTYDVQQLTTPEQQHRAFQKKPDPVILEIPLHVFITSKLILMSEFFYLYFFISCHFTMVLAQSVRVALLVTAVSAYKLPDFSWDTLPVAWHSAVPAKELAAADIDVLRKYASHHNILDYH